MGPSTDSFCRLLTCCGTCPGSWVALTTLDKHPARQPTQAVAVSSLPKHLQALAGVGEMRSGTCR